MRHADDEVDVDVEVEVEIGGAVSVEAKLVLLVYAECWGYAEGGRLEEAEVCPSAKGTRSGRPSSSEGRSCVATATWNRNP